MDDKTNLDDLSKEELLKLLKAHMDHIDDGNKILRAIAKAPRENEIVLDNTVLSIIDEWIFKNAVLQVRLDSIEFGSTIH